VYPLAGKRCWFMLRRQNTNVPQFTTGHPINLTNYLVTDVSDTNTHSSLINILIFNAAPISYSNIVQCGIFVSVPIWRIINYCLICSSLFFIYNFQHLCSSNSVLKNISDIANFYFETVFFNSGTGYFDLF